MSSDIDKENQAILAAFKKEELVSTESNPAKMQVVFPAQFGSLDQGQKITYQFQPSPDMVPFTPSPYMPAAQIISNKIVWYKKDFYYRFTTSGPQPMFDVIDVPPGASVLIVRADDSDTANQIAQVEWHKWLKSATVQPEVYDPETGNRVYKYNYVLKVDQMEVDKCKV